MYPPKFFFPPWMMEKLVIERWRKTNLDISGEELEEALFPPQDETVETETEPVGDEPHRRPYPTRPRYQVRHTGRTNYTREQPGIRTNAGSSSNDSETFLGFLKLLQEKIGGASGGQTANAGKTIAIEINGKLVEVSAEAYAVLRDQREQLKLR